MIGVEAPSFIVTPRWPAVVVIQRVAEAPGAYQGTCTVSGPGSGVEQNGVQARCAVGMWSRSTTVHDERKWMRVGEICICMSSIIR